MNYEIFGGFEVPRKPGKPAVADPRARKDFWDEIEEDHPGLPAARGCYVFGIRAGRGILPWYVGKTCRQSFKGECFELHKLRHYDDAISDKKRGTPLLYFVARMTNRGKFSSSAPAREVKFLENLLIGMALQRNRLLKNIVHTTFLKGLHVPGLVNPVKGPPRGAAAVFKRMVGG